MKKLLTLVLFVVLLSSCVTMQNTSIKENTDFKFNETVIFETKNKGFNAGYFYSFYRVKGYAIITSDKVINSNTKINKVRVKDIYPEHKNK